MNRYPNNINLTIEDFKRSDWKTIADANSQKHFHLIAHAFASAASDAINKDNLNEGKVLRLLADACSMLLDPTSTSEPFKPFPILSNRRSALPNDFQESDILFFSQIAGHIDDHPWISARLADLVWILKRDHKFALMAIDSYKKIPLDKETWLRGGKECWDRAISLAQLLGKAAEDQLRELESAVLAQFEIASITDGFLPLWLARLIREKRLGYAQRVEIANKLEELGNQLKAIGQLRDSKHYYSESAEWFRRCANEDKWAEMQVCVAESWVEEANAHMSSEQPNYPVAAHHLENAIQEYREIPHAKRSTHNVEQRILDLRAKLRITTEKSVDGMGVYTSPHTDISETVAAARDSVRGKSSFEAMASFSAIYPGASVSRVRKQSEDILQSFPLHLFVSRQHLSRDGRVVAKSSEAAPLDPAGKVNSEALWEKMIELYSLEVSVAAQGAILPALEILHLEHRTRLDDFVSLAHQSPIVPPNRHRLFGKGLFSGYDKDFTSAIHLLIPQVEHMVRWHLKMRGISTTTLDENGIEMEKGLSALADTTEVNQIFGEDIGFELKALFCDARGPNLRNHVAHGLIDYGACMSTYSVYAWWFCLRIVFNTYYNAVKKSDNNQGMMSQT